MSTFYEIVKTIAPACITGLVTFLITKYNYHQNVPLDKYEIAYNRVYYPIVCLVKNTEDILLVIEKSELYLIKYNKYVDRSTLIAFRQLKNNKSKSAYINFKNNVLNISYILRRKLGYLEPGFFSLYKYAAPIEKAALRIVIELAFIYILSFVSTINYTEQIENIIYKIIVVFFIAFLVDIVIIFIRFIAISIKRIIFLLKKHKL